MSDWRLPIAGLALLCLAACAPALNWREVPLPEAGLKATFPCRPKIERQGGAGLARCEAAGQVFAVAWQPMPGPQAAREALRTSVGRFEAQYGTPAARQTAAALPKDALALEEAGQFHWPLARTKLWARGLLVVQGTVLGTDEEAAVLFLDGLIGQE